MESEKKTPAQRRHALREFEEALRAAQDACEKLDPRDRKRMHLSGVDLHGVLGEMRDVREHAHGRVPAPKVEPYSAKTRADVDFVFSNIRDVDDVTLRNEILTEFAEYAWRAGLRLFREAMKPAQAR